MTRLLAAMKLDVRVQVRNKLYTIGIVVGVLVAVALSLLAEPQHLRIVLPTLILLVIGGSTLFYVAGLIIFEKDEGTLHAVVVSPLRTSEYLWSKILTLTALATLEALVMIGGALIVWQFTAVILWPNLLLLITGIVALGIISTLVGLVGVVRYDKVTDFLLPMAVVAIVLQLPAFYFFGVIEHPAFLTIPSSAPAMLIQGAYGPLAAWQWAYGILYSMIWIVVLSFWAHRAFEKYIVRESG